LIKQDAELVAAERNETLFIIYYHVCVGKSLAET